MNELQVLDGGIQKFIQYWGNLANVVPIYSQRAEIDFTSNEIKEKEQLILLRPSLDSGQRLSIGDTYTQRTSLLFMAVLYTDKKLGNTAHQAITAKIMDFFATQTISGASKQQDTLVTGPVLLSELNNRIVSNISSVYSIDSTKTLS